ncbi:MAG TPA: FAD:protein FMN transferase, partial [Myxococcota bacterium]|nr:FAD:protein FMN transferase [Myxococcota bacterium]
MLDGATMGTHWSVKAMPAPDGGTGPAALDTEIAALLDRLDAALSNWDPDAELARWNRSASTDWTPVSAELHAVLRAAARVSGWS